MPILIENWSVEPGQNNYRGQRLQGLAHNHPELGTQRIITSPIIDYSQMSRGGLVHTYSGSTYLLGKPQKKS